MIPYNICFVRQGDSLLLLNRERASWMGCWNGVGGKLEPGETPRRSMIRELQEETGLGEDDYTLSYKGLVTWMGDGFHFGGMHLYAAAVSERLVYPVPVKTSEGILDWKRLDWIVHPDNRGVATNLPVIVKELYNESPYHHHCEYSGDILLKADSFPIGAWAEEPDRLAAYLTRFREKTAIRHRI